VEVRKVGVKQIGRFERVWEVVWKFCGNKDR
jgi:hypothetical protein